MAACAICGFYVADDEKAYLMSEEDVTGALAHKECYLTLEAEGGQEAIMQALREYHSPV